MTDADAVLVERDGPVTIVSINRPHCRNAVDGLTARKLFDAFRAFDADAEASVAVFTGTGGYFCAGADLKAVASGDPNKKREVGGHDTIAPMGPSRLRLSKPVIAASSRTSSASPSNAQPSALPRMSPYSRRNIAAEKVTSPGRSRPVAPGSPWFTMRETDAQIAATPIGKLT